MKKQKTIKDLRLLLIIQRAAVDIKTEVLTEVASKKQRTEQKSVRCFKSMDLPIPPVPVTIIFVDIFNKSEGLSVDIVFPLNFNPILS